MLFVNKHRKSLRRLGLIFAFVFAVLATMRLTLAFGTITNAPTAAFSFLILVLLSAFFGDFIVSIITSIVATLCFNYFYLPPTGTFFIADFSDWISLTAFLLTAGVISRLTSSASENATKADLLDKTLVQLKTFGAWLLSISDDRQTLTGIAEEATRIFSLEYCSIHVYGEGKWRHFTGATASHLSEEIANRLKALNDHQTNLMELADENALDVRYVQINQGTTLQALLVVKSSALPLSALGSIAYMIGNRLTKIISNNYS